MASKFSIYKGRNGKLYFNLKGPNGEIILASQGYASRSGCLNGIASVRKNSGDASRFETRTSKRGQPYFVLKAANGQVVGRSEMYETRRGCANGIASVQKNAPRAKVARD